MHACEPYCFLWCRRVLIAYKFIYAQIAIEADLPLPPNPIHTHSFKLSSYCFRIKSFTLNTYKNIFPSVKHSFGKGYSFIFFRHSTSDLCHNLLHKCSDIDYIVQWRTDFCVDPGWLTCFLRSLRCSLWSRSLFYSFRLQLPLLLPGIPNNMSCVMLACQLRDAWCQPS